jgi:hypothetical protein
MAARLKGMGQPEYGRSRAVLTHRRLLGPPPRLLPAEGGRDGTSWHITGYHIILACGRDRMTGPGGIRPIPVLYRGVHFRSTLEADWAATLDSLGITWSYEPEGVELPSGERYRPDFWVESQRIWFEVKGPHDERIHKTRELDAYLEPELCRWANPYVVLGLPPEAGAAAMRTPAGGTVHFTPCLSCGHSSFMAEDYAWTCRVCQHALRLGYFAPKTPFIRAVHVGGLRDVG